ncbi:hypothetical protein Poli38472_008926 [Pythium oligandrum]|uniref:BZIP domain-containing protein n=1 Tax=Pythium oligandrum TaxID=41045 RepID=A0A8K1FEY3_PYTOL|nr:hypothetical protein Poli38472_008926 [Pythium oligandrum]|eukprot:TMW56278.1 hypothetical protein Poli38472_008926 [Pythium oligandrum]
MNSVRREGAWTQRQSGTSRAALTMASGAAKRTAIDEDKAERRRKQCRISQRRYRDKKGSTEYNLRLDINNLRENVEQLRRVRALLQSKIQNDQRLQNSSVVKAVEQYYLMFATGLHDPQSGGAHVERYYRIQVSFLRAFMAPNIKLGDGVGIVHVLKHWRRFTRYHASLSTKLNAVDVFGSATAPIVKAQSVLRVRISRTTIEKIFPHILSHDDIVQMLIGKEVAYAVCSEFVFDEKVQVVHHDTTIDFLAGLSQLLNDPYITADILRKALISKSNLLETPSTDEEDFDWMEDGDDDDDVELAGSARTIQRATDEEGKYGVESDDLEEKTDATLSGEDAASVSSATTDPDADSSSRHHLQFILS